MPDRAASQTMDNPEIRVVVLTLKGTPAYRAKVRALARKLRTPVSFLVEDAVSEYLAARNLKIGPRLSGRRWTERRLAKGNGE